MIGALTENPILLLFLVAGLGYGVGSISIRGTSLGVAAVLFVGLFVGSLSPELHIPEVIIFLGLSIFVYTVGLSSGPSFFETFKQRGWQDVFFVVVILTVTAAISAGIHLAFHWQGAKAAGLFVGSTTNTPALAGLLDAIRNSGLDPARQQELSEDSVIAYSIAYPMGVLAPIVLLGLLPRLLRVDFQKEERALRQQYPVRQDILNLSVEVTNPAFTGITVRDLRQQFTWTVLFSRLERAGRTFLINWETEFALGDKVSISGDREEVEEVAELLGTTLATQLAYNQSEYETRRIFVSNPVIVGKPLAALNLTEKYAAMITRVRRGDIDLLANANTMLELGDRVRVVARRKDMPALSKLFGDSYDQLSQIDLLSFGLGMAMGMVLGMITFTLPGGINFKLGFAGGPMIVGLLLGSLRRSGPIIWSLPYSANLILRQVGLILLLAGVGVNSGHKFAATLTQTGDGVWIFLGSLVASGATALFTIFLGYYLLKIPFSLLMGFASHHPAILEFALSRTKNKLPSIGYALMTPIAIVVKIIYAQLLFLWLRG